MLDHFKNLFIFSEEAGREAIDVIMIFQTTFLEALKSYDYQRNLWIIMNRFSSRKYTGTHCPIWRPVKANRF